MRKSIAVTVAIAAFVVGAFTVSMAGRASIVDPIQINVVEHATTDRVIDVGRPGDSPGDLLTFHNVLFDETNDHRVGKDQGDCVRISPGQGTWECRWIAWIDGMGSITVEGQFSDTNPTTFAITGGTDLFDNARGTMDLEFRNNAAELDFIYHLIP